MSPNVSGSKHIEVQGAQITSWVVHHNLNPVPLLETARLPERIWLKDQGETCRFPPWPPWITHSRPGEFQKITILPKRFGLLPV